MLKVVGVLLLLVAVAGAVVWFLSPGLTRVSAGKPGGRPAGPDEGPRSGDEVAAPPRRTGRRTGRRPVRHRARRGRVRFEEALELTAPENPDHGQRSPVYEAPGVSERPSAWHPVWSATRLIFLIAFLAALIALSLWAVGHLLNQWITGFFD